MPSISYLIYRWLPMAVSNAAALAIIAGLLTGCSGNNTPISAAAANTSTPVAADHTSWPSSAPASGNANGLPATAAATRPSLSGTPPTTAVVGQLYSFRPTAKDPSGGILDFSVRNKPAWAAFNTSTGELTGTPIAMDIGTVSNVVISVNAGAGGAATLPFSVHVLPAASKGVTVAWTAPTENTDGSPLVNLAGYRIHYGTNPSELSNMIEIDNAEMSSYTITSLSPGIWYFAVTALNSDSIESDFSAKVNTTI